MDFAAGIYLSEAQNPLPPPHTRCVRANSIFIHPDPEKPFRIHYNIYLLSYRKIIREGKAYAIAISYSLMSKAQVFI